MPRFVFWNIKRKPLYDRVARIAVNDRADLVALAECPLEVGRFERALNESKVPTWNAISEPKHGLQLFIRSGSGLRLAPLLTDRHWLIFSLRTENHPEMLVVVAHLRSQLHHRFPDRALELRRLVADINRAERDREHSRTVLVGDLNLDPYSELIVQSDTLHSVMTKSLANRETRTVQAHPSERIFYNPMWGLLGDRTPGPPGTYHRSPSGVVCYHWHLFDQVLLRSGLGDNLVELKIIETDGERSLLTNNGLPDQGNASDHLPIFFHLEEPA